MDGREINSKTGEITTATEYTETLLSLRHYSNLRFAIFGVFVAITAALLAALYGTGDPPLPKRLDVTLRLFGVLTAASFWWIEFTLDGYVSAFAKRAIALFPDSHLTLRPSIRRQGVPYATMSLHFGAVTFWILSLSQVWRT